MAQNDAERMVEQINANLLKIACKSGDYTTPVEGVGVHRRDDVETAECHFYQPFIAFMSQGRKRSIIGSEEYVYGAKNCLIIGVDAPSVSYITEASAEHPSLAISVRLDRRLVSSLASEIPVQTGHTSNKAMAILEADDDLLDAFLRLSKLFDKPEQVPFIAPMILREIHYRLLAGPLGFYLKDIYTLGTKRNLIAQAIALLRENYKGELCVETLAGRVNMATSTFHRHFKEVTTLSPLQYQKHLRLHEAQRLMISENMSVGEAGHFVGYESLTQFSREYKRLFGEPPYRDANKLRE